EHPASQERLGKPVVVKQPAALVDEEDRLRQRLLTEHRYTPAAACSFMQELRDLAVRLKNIGRRPGQIITFGVAADEPPGRSLNEARLCLVALDYITRKTGARLKGPAPRSSSGSA
ncbi:MAG: hypothetical protein AB1767_13270, partial [Bacillota bacterium]